MNSGKKKFFAVYIKFIFCSILSYIFFILFLWPINNNLFLFIFIAILYIFVVKETKRSLKQNFLKKWGKANWIQDYRQIKAEYTIYLALVLSAPLLIIFIISDIVSYIFLIFSFDLISVGYLYFRNILEKDTDIKDYLLVVKG